MKKVTKAVLLILWMALIFYMSAQPQLESEATSNLATELIYRIFGGIFRYFGMTLEDFFGRFGQLIRKLAHFTEFMILGILAKTNQEEYTDRNTILVPLLFSALYAISDEIHQSFVPGRCCAVKDMLIDTSGAFTGIIIYHLIMKGWKRRHSH